MPPPSFWWLSHYPAFHVYLNSRCGKLVHDEETCLIYDLQDASVKPVAVRSRRLNNQIREVVERRLPAEATVAVIAEQDDDLLWLGERTVWHFARDARGAPAPFPASSAEAIARLESKRAWGADYLLVPAVGLKRLEEHPDFRRHLDRHYRMVAHVTADDDQDVCILYAIQPFRKQPGTPRPFGVNVAGCLPSEKGMGEAARADVRGLEAAGVPYVLNNFLDAGSVNQDATFARFADDNPYPFNLVHLNADAVPAFVCQRGEAYFHGRYNIGFWAWELAEFPDQWETSFQYFDEIWVASSFVLDAVSRASRVPVVRIPHS